jgi:hypothetical protein
MELTTRAFWTMIHGMAFGALYLMACSGALVELSRATHPSSAATFRPNFIRAYLIAMAILAWFAVLSGTYIVYSWYRAVPPPGTTDLAHFPQRLLLSSRATSGWHTLGMEWKEHVAWLVPISITMVAAVVLRYGSHLRHHPRIRSTLIAFLAVSFLAAAIAGFFGAMLNKFAPVNGGPTISLPGGPSE